VTGCDSEDRKKKGFFLVMDPNLPCKDSDSPSVSVFSNSRFGLEN
jgi:hypothetical protein